MHFVLQRSPLAPLRKGVKPLSKQELTLIGPCEHCLENLRRQAKNLGLGTIITTKNGIVVLEVKNASAKEIARVKELAEKVDVTEYREGQ